MIKYNYFLFYLIVNLKNEIILKCYFPFYVNVCKNDDDVDNVIDTDADNDNEYAYVYEYVYVDVYEYDFHF